MHKITPTISRLCDGSVTRLTGRREYVHIAAIPSLSIFSDLRVWGMPVEERRKPIHGGLTAARAPRMARMQILQEQKSVLLPTPINRATAPPSLGCRRYFMLVP